MNSRIAVRVLPVVAWIASTAAMGVADELAKPTATVAVNAVSNRGPLQWPQYRGPNRDGVSSEQVKWPAAGPKKVWEIELAKGYGSMTVQQGRLYVLGTPGKGSDLSCASTYCLDAATGKTLWEHRTDKVADVTGATPSVTDGRVVSVGPGGELVCLDADSGKLLWEVRMRLKNNPYCYGSSPLIHGDKVIVQAGPSIRAFAVADGKEVWKADWAIPDGGGRWTSPALGTFDGTNTVVCLSRSNLVGLDPADGKLLWKLDLETNPSGEDLFNTPIITGNRVVCMAYRLTGARSTRLICVEVRGGKPKECWRAPIRTGNRSQSPAIWDHCVYLTSDTSPIKTPQDSRGRLICYDLQTGKVVWISSAPESTGPPPSGKLEIWNDGGAFMIAGGKVLLLDGTGRISMADVSAKGCTVLGSTDFDEDARVPGGDPKSRGPLQSRFQFLTPPLLLNGLLYVRDHEKMVCYDLRE